MEKGLVPYKMKHGYVVELKKGIDYDGLLGEVCICAAIKMSDGYIVRGHRHNDCYRTMKGIERYKKALVYPFDSITEGFLTTKNRFVERKEGLQLQLAASIKSADREGSYRDDQLYSEDLY